MSWTIHTISTNYNGRTYNVDYWVDGNGMETDGYVTDFAQYCADVTEHFEEDDIDFVTITSDGTSKQITDSDDLQEAVENLVDGGILSVQALDKGSAGKRSKNKRKGKKKNKRVEEEEEEESDTDEWYAVEPVKNTRMDKSHKKILTVLDRFVTHLGTCHYCEETALSGRRYIYAYSTGYSMCGSCYDDLSKSEKEDWNDSGLPWDEDAPEAPLDRRDDYAILDDVKHLQYLLTRLGHMKLGDTEEITGSYQKNTERAVASFRKTYGVKGGDMTVYNGKTAAKLAQVVRKLRNEGHKYM